MPPDSRPFRWSASLQLKTLLKKVSLVIHRVAFSLKYALHGFSSWVDHLFFLVNRVENQKEPKRPQSGSRLGSFWFSTCLWADRGTNYNLHLITNVLWVLYFNAWCRLLSLPGSVQGRVENKNKPKRPTVCDRLGSFWFLTRFFKKKVIRPTRKLSTVRGYSCMRGLYNRENIKQMTCTSRTKSISADHTPGSFFSVKIKVTLFLRGYVFSFSMALLCFFFHGG